MGIKGLLPFIGEGKAINKTGHLKDFKGKTVAVDAYVWIYKGCSSNKCAKGLALKEDPRHYIGYCNKQISLLQANGITPILVFDGGKLPSKKLTEEARKKPMAMPRR